MTYSLQARVVFPVDRSPIERGCVTIDGEQIVAVGTNAECDNVTDLENVALLPGLVNAHTHLEFSDLRRPLGEPGMPLVDWIRRVIAERGRGDRDASQSILSGLKESADHGVTTIGEIASISAEGYAESTVDVTHFAEVIGFSQARADSAFAAVGQRLAAPANRLNVQLGISPHAPYTVSMDLLRRLIALAHDRDLPVAMHVAESADELELLRSGTGPLRHLLEERSMWDATAIPRGSRPLDYLRMLAEAPRALVIHGNLLDDEEQAFLAANVERMSLVYCPRTHSYFRHPAYPLVQLLSSGVRVALGTDSRASNPDLDLLAEMRHVARANLAIDAQMILRMGTLSGAEALGCAADVGSITPGKLANLVAVPLADGADGSTDELLAGVLNGDEGPRTVWLHGVKA